MSTATATTADSTGSDKNEGNKEKSEITTTTTTTTNIKLADPKAMKKVRSKKDLKNDPSRFESPGVNFNAKLIGIDEVTSARGDKMCQEAIQRLKLAVKSSGQHKQKIIVNVSLEGVRLIDLKSQAVNHTHLVHRISFISRDITDARAFGYIYGAGEGKHKFFAVKTEKAAEALVLTLRDLFQAVYEMKKKEVEEAKQKQEETVETAEEAKDKEEPVYQVPKSGAPVENPEDPTYQVPTNNAPVNKTEDNLLNLENELESIEKGIEQINDLEDMFSDLRSPTTTTQSTTAWGDELQSSMAQASVSSQPSFSVGGAPFSTSSTTMPQGGMFGLPFSTAGSATGGFGNQPWGPTVSQPGGAPNPFGAPSVPQRTGPGMGFPPSTGGFPPTPFPGPGQLSRPSFPTGQTQTAPASGPAPASDPFGNDPFAVGDSGGFGDGLLTPDKIEDPKDESAQKQEGKKDAFGDLVNIGSKEKQNKSPKQMFTDLATPPKKSLNELKVEKAPSPKPASPVGFQASETSEEVKQGNAPSPADFKALGQFENMNPFGSEDPFGSSDPFASHVPVNHSQIQNAPAQRKEMNAPSQKALFEGSIFDDDFNLPAPTGAPPPLPTNINNVSISAVSIPPPPPRNNINTPPNTQNTPPLPPRPRSVSAASQDSLKDEIKSHSDTVHVPQTPPLPPRLHLQPSSSNNGSVPNPSLSEIVIKDKDTTDKPNSEVRIDATKYSDNMNERLNKSVDSETGLLKSDLRNWSDQKQCDLIETSRVESSITCLNEGDSVAMSTANDKLSTSVRSAISQLEQDKLEFTQISPKSSKSDLSMSVCDSENKDMNLQKDESISKNLNKQITGDDGVNCDTNRISADGASNEDKMNKKDYTQTSVDDTAGQNQSQSLVDKTVDHNFNKTHLSSVSDPFVSIDPFASDNPFAHNDPFSTDPFASDPFSDSVSTSSVSSTTSNDPFTSAFTNQRFSHSSIDTGDDPFSVFDKTFEPFHFEKSKKSKVKLKYQGGQ